jgi:putative flippase GtrA
MKPIIKFALAGSVGYVVDVCVLLLANPVLGPHIARIFSFFAAVITTWLINRRITFVVNDSFGIVHEFTRYFVTSLGGGSVNIITYSFLVSLFKLPTLLLPVAVGIGSLTGMCVNYLLAKKFIYYKNKESLNAESQE